MASDNKHRTESEAFSRYHSGEMTLAERHAFEKAILNDPFAQEALEGMESLDPEQLQADLNLLETQLREKTHRGQAFVIWRVAAALVLVGIFSFVIYYFIETGAPTEIAMDKSMSTEQSDTLASDQKSTPVTVHPAEPDRIIAYHPPPKEKSAPSPVIERQAEESTALIDQVAASEEEVVVTIENQVTNTPVQLEEITVTGDALVKEEQSLAAAVAEVADSNAEKKKDSATGARRQKASAAEQPSAVVPSPAFGQERKIRGTVTSEDDDSPTPGVNVIVKGTTTGTVTDIDGNYELSIPEGQETILVFSSVGYNTEEVAMAKDTEVDVVMQADVTALSEIVVTGYATSSTNEPVPYSFTPPKPIGGQAKFKEYIKEHLRYPASGLAAGITGSVKVQFTIEANGNMVNLHIVHGLGRDFDNEALRLIMDGPKWVPAEENSTKVSREVKITIRFKPPE